jgi:hypothetical protein
MKMSASRKGAREVLRRLGLGWDGAVNAGVPGGYHHSGCFVALRYE